MPTYTFHNKTTGVVEDVFLKISEKEQYLKDNVEQVHTGINIVAGVGRIKGDSGWKENLSSERNI